MKINIFEGGRRIIKILTAISVILYFPFVFFEFKSNPHIEFYYIVTSPDEFYTVNDSANGCGFYVHLEKIKFNTKKDTSVKVNLCFQPSYFENLNRFYKFNPDFDHSVLTDDYVRSFKLPASDEKLADEKKWAKKSDNLYNYTGVLVGWLIFLWVFSWAAGWIVRGFLGTPSGQDQK